MRSFACSMFCNFLCFISFGSQKLHNRFIPPLHLPSVLIGAQTIICQRSTCDGGCSYRLMMSCPALKSRLCIASTFCRCCCIEIKFISGKISRIHDLSENDGRCSAYSHFQCRCAVLVKVAPQTAKHSHRDTSSYRKKRCCRYCASWRRHRLLIFVSISPSVHIGTLFASRENAERICVMVIYFYF